MHSFVEFAKKLLTLDVMNYFLSDKLNQNPLEEHFGRQRGCGGASNNRTPEQNTPNENKILVVNITCEEIQEDDKETQNRLTFTITHHCQSEKRKNSKVEIR